MVDAITLSLGAQAVQAGSTASGARALATGEQANFTSAAATLRSTSVQSQFAAVASAKESISRGIGVVVSAANGASALQSVLGRMRDIASTAYDTADPDARASLVGQFNDLVTQLDAIAADSGYQGINLLMPGQALQVNFGGVPTETFSILPAEANSHGLGVDTVAADPSSSSDPQYTADALSAAIGQVDGAIGKLGTLQRGLNDGLTTLTDVTAAASSFATGSDLGLRQLGNAGLTAGAATVLAGETGMLLGNTTLSIVNVSQLSLLGLL